MTAHTAHAAETGAGPASAAPPESPHAAIPANASPQRASAPVENGTGTDAAQQEAATASATNNGSAGTEAQPTKEGVTEQVVLRFRRGTRLQYDRVREQWFIQAPERAFFADPVAAEILQLVNGKRKVGAVIDQLCQKFAAPRETITQDVLRMVQELADKQVLQAV